MLVQTVSFRALPSGCRQLTVIVQQLANPFAVAPSGLALVGRGGPGVTFGHPRLCYVDPSGFPVVTAGCFPSPRAVPSFFRTFPDGFSLVSQ